MIGPTTFPVARDDHPSARLFVPWHVGVQAWQAYAKKYGASQSVERIAQRGGFGEREMDELRPGWRSTVVGGERS